MIGDLFYGESLRFIVYLLTTISLYSLAVSYCYVHHSFFSKITIYPILFALYIVIICLINFSPINDLIIHTSWVPLFCMGYITGLKKESEIPSLLLYSLLAVVIVVFIFISMKNMSNIVQARTNIRHITLVSYLYMPVLAGLKSKFTIKEILLVILLIVCTLISFKRTSILMIFAGITVYLIFKLYHNNIKKVKAGMIKRIAILLLFGLFSYFLIIYVDELSEGFIFKRFSNLEESGGNGRADIWGMVLASFSSQSYFKIFGGNGSEGVLNLCGTTSHNDFLEYLYDYGIIGSTILVIFYLTLLRQFHVRKYPLQTGASIAYAFTIGLFISMFSHMIIYPQECMPFFFILGSLLGKGINRNQFKRIYLHTNDTSI